MFWSWVIVLCAAVGAPPCEAGTVVVVVDGVLEAEED
jgi:hypothetical protein